MSALPVLPPDEGIDPASHLRGAQGRPRRSYDAAFRTEAVKRATAEGARISDLAAELEVSPSTLRRWVKAETQDSESPNATPPAPPATPAAEASLPAEASPASAASPSSAASGPPSQDGEKPSDVETGSLVEGREPTVNDADRRHQIFDEPSMEGSRTSPTGDPLAADATADVLSAEPGSDSLRQRSAARSGSLARTASGSVAATDRTTATYAAQHTGSDTGQHTGQHTGSDTGQHIGQDTGQITENLGADRSGGSRTDDPNVLAMLDAILEMIPKHLANAQAAADLSEPSPPTHRPVEAEADRTLRPGDDIFPGLSALVPAYRFPIILAFLLGAIGVSRFVPVDYALRPVALALHIISLVIAFGAVLVIDWHGLLWLFGRRGLTESTRLAAAAGPLIWGGLFGLIASGALLHPDISSPLTLLKLALVLMVAWNGAAMSTLRHKMALLPSSVKPTDLPLRDWTMLMGATVISQVGWWGAIIIGFINSST